MCHMMRRVEKQKMQFCLYGVNRQKFDLTSEQLANLLQGSKYVYEIRATEYTEL